MEQVERQTGVPAGADDSRRWPRRGRRSGTDRHHGRSTRTRPCHRRPRHRRRRQPKPRLRPQPEPTTTTEPPPTTTTTEPPPPPTTTTTEPAPPAEKRRWHRRPRTRRPRSWPLRRAIRAAPRMPPPRAFLRAAQAASAPPPPSPRRPADLAGSPASAFFLTACNEWPCPRDLVRGWEQAGASSANGRVGYLTDEGRRAHCGRVGRSVFRGRAGGPGTDLPRPESRRFGHSSSVTQAPSWRRFRTSAMRSQASA